MTTIQTDAPVLMELGKEISDPIVEPMFPKQTRELITDSIIYLLANYGKKNLWDKALYGIPINHLNLGVELITFVATRVSWGSLFYKYKMLTGNTNIDKLLFSLGPHLTITSFYTNNITEVSDDIFSLFVVFLKDYLTE